jgi:thioredoxin reductase (NADPH)
LLLSRLKRQTADLGVAVIGGTVETLSRFDDVFVARHKAGDARACKVILASGIVDKQPHLNGWEGAVHDGLLRYCPICDAYEVSEKKLAVTGKMSDAQTRLFS